MSVANPSTFLDLCQRLASECGVSGSGPSAVTGQTGESARLVNWIASSWLSIQRRHADWSFLLVSPGVSFVTVAGQVYYTPTQTGVTAGVVGQWKRNTFRCYNTTAGTPSEIFLNYVDYDYFRDVYQLGNLRTSQVQPTVVTITPEFSVGIQTPAAGYTITGDYFTVPIALEDDGDIPTIPSQFIMSIVYKAMMDFASYESAPEVFQRGQMGYLEFMRQMEKNRLPEILAVGCL
jgi:hypothetical protein